MRYLNYLLLVYCTYVCVTEMEKTGGISLATETTKTRVKLNQNISFKCLLSQSNNVSDKVNISWSKDHLVLFHGNDMTENAKKKRAYKNYYSINMESYEKGTYHLNIRSAKFVHAGNYTCEVGEKRKTIHLDVIVLPRVILAVRPTKQIYEEGDNVELKCLSIGYPLAKLTWFISGNLLNSSDKNITVTSKQMENITPSKRNSTTSSSLSIKLNITFNKAVVRCDALLTNLSGTETFPVTTKHFVFSVDYKQLAVFPDEKVVTEGKKLNILCRINGIPNPIVKFWTKDGIKIKETQKEIIVNDAKKSDAGLYRCFVENEKGTSNYSIKVHVVAGAGGLTRNTWKIILGGGVPLILMVLGLLALRALKHRNESIRKSVSRTSSDTYYDDTYTTTFNTTTATTTMSEDFRQRVRKRRNKNKDKKKDRHKESIIDTAARMSQSRLKQTSDCEPTNRDYTTPNANACEDTVMANTKLNAKSSAHIIDDWDYDYAPGGAQATKAERTAQVKTKPEKVRKRTKPKQPMPIRSRSNANTKKRPSSNNSRRRSHFDSFTDDDLTDDTITYTDATDVSNRRDAINRHDFNNRRDSINRRDSNNRGDVNNRRDAKNRRDGNYRHSENCRRR